MISPETIRQKAIKLYTKVLQACLEGNDSFFPKTIPARKTLDPNNLPEAIEAVRALRDGSKEVRGFGYSIVWTDRNSRTFGKNRFPERIYFETREDLLRLIGRRQEFQAFSKAVDSIRDQFPQLENWLKRNRKLLIEASSETEGLIKVTHYFLAHPRPNLFARELPLDLDTKFIERHERILREWFDLILPPHAIHADENHFDRRFGLHYAEPQLLTRFLDPQVAQEVNCPYTELSLPLRSLSALPFKAVQAFIVENKVNLLTLPSLKRGIGFGGLGRSVTNLRYLKWLKSAEIFYWGDLDVEGFQILSSLRMLFPETKSFLMDMKTLERGKRIATPGRGTRPEVPALLTKEEADVFLCCRDEDLRLEQEKVLHTDVIQAISRFATLL